MRNRRRTVAEALTPTNTFTIGEAGAVTLAGTSNRPSGATSPTLPVRHLVHPVADGFLRPAVAQHRPVPLRQRHSVNDVNAPRVTNRRQGYGVDHRLVPGKTGRFRGNVQRFDAPAVRSPDQFGWLSQEQAMIGRRFYLLSEGSAGAAGIVRK